MKGCWAMNSETFTGFYRAIIAVDKELRAGHLLEWIGDVPENIKDKEERYDILSETHFNFPHGVYVARIYPGHYNDYEWTIETNVSDRIKWDSLK